MKQNPNTTTPAVADLPQRLVDAAYNAAYDVRYDVDGADIRAATVAVLRDFAAHLNQLTTCEPQSDYLEGHDDGLERAATVALRVASELEQGNGNQ